MNRKSLIFLSIVLIMTISMVVFGSNGTQIGTIGARSSGMGSNFRGLLVAQIGSKRREKHQGGPLNKADGSREAEDQFKDCHRQSQ